MPNGSGGGLQKQCRNPQYRKIAEVGSNPIPGSIMYCFLRELLVYEYWNPTISHCQMAVSIVGERFHKRFVFLEQWIIMLLGLKSRF